MRNFATYTLLFFSISFFVSLSRAETETEIATRNSIAQELPAKAAPGIFSVSPKSDFYSEVSSDRRLGDTVYYSKLTRDVARLTQDLSGYLGLAVSQDSLSQGSLLYNDNYVAPLLGARLKGARWPVSFFAEYRWVAATIAGPVSENSAMDFRTGFQLGKVFESAKFTPRGPSFFDEVYGEGVYSSRLESDVFFSVFNKAGLQQTWLKNFLSQVYLEGAATRDALGYYYENFQEARAGLRQKVTVGGFTVSVSATYGLGSYTDREYLDPNPFGRNYSGWKYLLVLGGQL